MKVASEKIEVLYSTHEDNKEERLPKNNKWQLTIAQWSFKTLGNIAPKMMAQKAYDIFATPRWKAKHTRTDSIIDSARVKEFPFQGETIKLYEWGNFNNPIILLAHGWESRGTALRMFIPHLIQNGFAVLAFDAIGHGDSTGIKNNLPTNGKTIAAIINHYGGIYGAICHSFGCSSIIYAQQFVDNSISIEKLIFLAVPHRTRKITDSYLKMIQAPAAVKSNFYSMVEKVAERSVEDLDVAPSEKHVKVGQLLLIHDRYDDITSLDAAERVVENWDNAKLLITEGYGHFRLAKNPDVLKRIISFILE